MSVPLNALEDVIHFAALLCMPVTVSLCAAIIAVLVWGKTLPHPRNAIYWVCAIGCCADAATIVAINIGGVVPARGWMPQAYLQTEIPSHLFMMCMWSCRSVQMTTAITLALNRLTAIVLPLRYEKMWSCGAAIRLAVGTQALIALVFGCIGARFDTLWYYSRERGFWYTMLAERDFTKAVLATVVYLNAMEMAVLTLLYSFVLVKMRAISAGGNAGISLQSRSLLQLAIAVGGLELFYNIVYALTHVFWQDFNIDPRNLYIIFVVQFNLHSTAQPFLLICFCQPVRQGLTLLLRAIRKKKPRVRSAEEFAMQTATVIAMPD